MNKHLIKAALVAVSLAAGSSQPTLAFADGSDGNNVQYLCYPSTYYLDYTYVNDQGQLVNTYECHLGFCCCYTNTYPNDCDACQNEC